MSSTEKPTILVAEDNDALRELLRELLTAAGYHVLEAPDGRRLVRLVATREIDAVLLDVRLGVDDGILLGRELRELEPELPIALVSGDSFQAEDVRRAAGLTDLFLSKPFTRRRAQPHRGRNARSAAPKRFWPGCHLAPVPDDVRGAG